MRFVGLYCIIILQCAVQKNMKKVQKNIKNSINYVSTEVT